jgi:hypothetical protein
MSLRRCRELNPSDPRVGACAAPTAPVCPMRGHCPDPGERLMAESKRIRDNPRDAVQGPKITLLRLRVLRVLDSGLGIALTVCNVDGGVPREREA